MPARKTYPRKSPRGRQGQNTDTGCVNTTQRKNSAWAASTTRHTSKTITTNTCTQTQHTEKHARAHAKAQPCARKFLRGRRGTRKRANPSPHSQHQTQREHGPQDSSRELTSLRRSSHCAGRGDFVIFKITPTPLRAMPDSRSPSNEARSTASTKSIVSQELSPAGSTNSSSHTAPNQKASLGGERSHLPAANQAPAIGLCKMAAKVCKPDLRETNRRACHTAFAACERRLSRLHLAHSAKASAKSSKHSHAGAPIQTAAAT